ncbi:MAG: twin-arginine translocation signal domain-containing protein [Candidatus Kapaibacterium sp.]
MNHSNSKTRRNFFKTAAASAAGMAAMSLNPFKIISKESKNDEQPAVRLHPEAVKRTKRSLK